MYEAEEVQLMFGFSSLSALYLAVAEARFPQPVQDEGRQAKPTWDGSVLRRWRQIKPLLRREPISGDQPPPPPAKKSGKKTGADSAELEADSP
jgi:hypothetical protein